MTAASALLAGLIDYAGLFPPASLDMLSAVRRYREYLAGEDRWALGKFIVPAARLRDFSAAFNGVCCGERETLWRLSILASADPASDQAAIAALDEGAFSIASIEIKAASRADADRLFSLFNTGTAAYVEFPPADAPRMLPALVRSGVRAKIRTGGLTADAIPSTETVAGFLAECAHAHVPFKATAGLHHAVRAAHPLTYEPQSPRATMHGFANVFLAAVLAQRGEDPPALIKTLNLSDAGSFSFSDDTVRWLTFHACIDEIQAVRREFAISYGSCSFEEPLQEAKALGWL